MNHPSTAARHLAPRTDEGTGRVRLGLALVLALSLLGALLVAGSGTARAATAYHVSPSGSDSAAGTAAAPWKSLDAAMERLGPGDTLVVHGGTYAERVNVSAQPGTAAAPVHVQAAPGERPVVRGLLWLKGASYWTLDGINVTWDPASSSSEHMVKMTGGEGWRITGAEIWGAHSYAGVLVAGTPSRWKLDHLYVHDTYASNGTNQDHLVYVNAGTGGGVIERSVFARSANGRGIKIGPSSSSGAATGNVVVRYNTFQDNTGPSNIQLSYSATGNQIYRNIFDGSGSGKSNVTAYNLHGAGNVAHDNVGWRSAGVLDSSPNLRDGGGNTMLDPKLAPADLLPQNASATPYGHGA
jgi:hypothetical protein